MDTVIGQIGLCVQLLAREELEQEQEPASTLHLLTEKLSARETVAKSRNATILNAKVYL